MLIGFFSGEKNMSVYSRSFTQLLATEIELYWMKHYLVVQMKNVIQHIGIQFNLAWMHYERHFFFLNLKTQRCYANDFPEPYFTFSLREQ